MPFVHVALAVEGCGWTDADNLPLMVASTLLGSWDRSHGGGPSLASRLASQCAKHNLCHSYQAFNTCYKDTGLWGVYFVADPLMQEVRVNLFNIFAPVSCSAPTMFFSAS